MTQRPIDQETLERMARDLGAREARRIDPEGTARAVRTRLAREGRTAVHAWWRPARLVQVAAVVALLVGVSVFLPRLGSDEVVPVEALVPVQLDDLVVTELDEVLDSLDFEASVSELVPVGLDDLSEAELQDLLETLEG